MDQGTRAVRRVRRAGGHGRLHAPGLVPQRRPRRDGRGRVADHHRSHQGADHPRRREHLLGRGRAGARAAPRGSSSGGGGRAVPTSAWGERVVAFVVGRSTSTWPSAVAGSTELGVARFKTPEIVVQVEQVPLLAAGKPDRAGLRDRVAAWGRPGERTVPRPTGRQVGGRSRGLVAEPRGGGLPRRGPLVAGGQRRRPGAVSVAGGGVRLGSQMAGPAGRRPLGGDPLARGLRRPGGHAAAGGHLQPRVRPVAGAPAGQSQRHQPRRPDPAGPRHRGAEGALVAPHPRRPGDLVPAVQRAGGRVRPGLA